MRRVQRHGVSIQVLIAWSERQVVGRFNTLVLEHFVPASVSISESHEFFDFLEECLGLCGLLLSNWNESAWGAIVFTVAEGRWFIVVKVQASEDHL